MSILRGSSERNVKERPEMELKKTAEEAEDLLNRIRASQKNDDLLLNHATRLVQDVEGLVMKLQNSETKSSWRIKLDELQQELQMATSTIPAARTTIDPSPESLQEVVGDIDDLLGGLTIKESPTEEIQAKGPTIPGRRFKKVVRSPSGIPHPLSRQRTLDSKLLDAHDVVGQGDHAHSPNINTAEIKEKEVDFEAQRYPTKPLRVALPVPPEIAAAAEASPAKSHGSADSTIARRGGRSTSNDESDSDESITSPENHEEVSNFS